MARDFLIPGEVMVHVKGNGALNLSGTAFFSTGQFHELGLAPEQVRIVPNFRYRDALTDSFGPDVPPEVMTQLADVSFRILLIHHDRFVLDAMLAESLGGLRDDVIPPGGLGPTLAAGLLAPCGTPLGKLKPLYASGNNYFGVQLTCGQALSGRPWRFPACYLVGPPVEYPLGSEVTVPVLNVRAIPYKVPPTVLVTSGGVNVPGEILSSGVPLWYRYSG